MNENSIIAIILSLIAVGGTLVGIWIGGLRERSNEVRRWRRDRCLEAYSEVFSACYNVFIESDKAYVIECGSLEHNKQTDIVLNKVSEMYHTTDKTVLLGPKDLYLKILDLTLYGGNEVGAKSVKCPKLTENEWHKIRDNFATLFAECRHAARNDLEIYTKL